jgi:hypothetical protein
MASTAQTKIPTMAGATKTPIDVGAVAAATSGANPSTTQFGPGVPLTPESGNPVRVWDFPVSTNTVITPRAYETNFKTLRAYANVEMIRLAIETRKDQVEACSWSLKPKASKKATPEQQDQIDAMTAFWEFPDGVQDFSTWLRSSLEDLFVLDAATWEMRRTRGGGISGAGVLLGLDVIPGDTIHPMVDATGRRPRGPHDVAYQQVIKGRPWANLTNSDILYAPRNVRPGHNYGMGPVEQIVVTINTFMRRQAAQLAYFTEGNTPAGFLTGPEGWSPEQVAAMQAMLDDRIAGSTADQAKLLFMPAGAKYQSFKDSPLKDDFDEWLARVVCFAFNIPPTPFIKAMNRSTAETDKERAQAEGLQPIKLWWKRVANRVMRAEGVTGIEWAWDDDIDIDPALQSQMDDRDLRNGSRTLDEVRERRGDQAYGKGIGDKPMIIMTSGAVLVEDAIMPPVEPPAPVHVIANPDGSTTPVAPPSVAPQQSDQPPKVAPKAKAGDAKAATSDHAATDKPEPTSKIEKSAKRKSDDIDVDRPVPRRAIKGLAKAATATLQAVGDDVAVHVARSLRALAKADDGDLKAAQFALAAKLAAEADLSGLDDLTGPIIDDLFDVVIDSATAGLAQVGAKASDGLIGQVHDRAVAYAKQRSAELVATGSPKGIMDSTRNGIRNTIVAGLSDAKSAPQIAADIQASQTFSPERAQLIAETEIKNANSQGVLEAYRLAEANGISLNKYWQTNGGEHCCDDCQGNEDQGPIPIDEPFQSGDDCPAAHPGCNCSMNSVFVDANGDETDDGDE